MGKKLVISGADFSANAVERDYSWSTILEGSLTQDVENGIKIIPLSRVLPEGTVTKLTQQLIGSGKSLCVAEDVNNVRHNDVWHGQIDSDSGVVVDQKELSFDMKNFVIWVYAIGTTLNYKLEIQVV